MGFHPNTPAGDNPLHPVCKSIRFCGGGKQINDKIYKRQKNTPVRLDGSISHYRRLRKQKYFCLQLGFQGDDPLGRSAEGNALCRKKGETSWRNFGADASPSPQTALQTTSIPLSPSIAECIKRISQAVWHTPPCSASRASSLPMTLP